MTQVTLDVRKELEEARLRPFHWMLIVIVWLAIFFDGYDVFVPAYVIHFVVEPWGLTKAEGGLLVSAGLVGVGIGAITQGFVADRIGRRPTMIAGLIISGVLSAATPLIGTSFGNFLLIRVLTGLGLGVVMPLGTAYINEYLPKLTRNRLASLAAAGFSMGAVAVALLGAVYTQAYGWQILFYIGSGAALVGVLFIFVFPESAEWLAAHGRQEEARRIMARIRPERAEAYANATLTAAAAGPRGWAIPLQPRYLVATLALWTGAFMLLFGNYGLSAWTPNVMVEETGSFEGGFSFGAALHSVPFLGGILCGWLADRWLGKRTALAIWAGLGALTTLSIAFSTNAVANFFLVAAAGFFIIGAQFMINNICAMTYPVQARSTGVGLMLGVGRLGAILGPYLGGALIGAFGNHLVFVAVAVAAAIVMAAAYFVIPKPTAETGTAATLEQARAGA